MLVYSDGLGYYDPDQIGVVENILAQAEQLKVVRDCQIAFFYHGYLPPGELARIIEGLKSMGYEFTDLRDTPYRVVGEGITIVSVDGRQQVTSTISPASREEMTGIRLYFNRWVILLSGLLIIILLSYIILILTLRKNKKRLYETR